MQNYRKLLEKIFELEVEISNSNGATHLRTTSQLNQQTQMSQLSWLKAQLDPTRMETLDLINGKILILEKLSEINIGKNAKILDLKVEMDLRYLTRMEPPTSEQHLS